MALSWQELVNLTEDDTQTTEDIDVTTVKDETTVGDYIADVVRAPIGGASRAVQGLLQLGAIPIDYVANTNLTSKLDELFNNIGNYTDAKTGVGSLVQTIVQFGVPLGVASKIGSGMRILKGAGEMRKLSSLPTIGAKGTELARRAGYFGALGGTTDLVAGVSGYNEPLTVTLGLEEEVNLDNLEGRERAAEAFKQKIRFGAEGATVGAGITMLPVAGTVGAKLLGGMYGKVIAPVGGAALRALDTAVINPLSVGLAGKGEAGSIVTKAIKKGGALSEEATKKLGLPDQAQWKFFDPKAGTFGQRVLKKLDNLKNNFTSAGILSPTLKAEGDRIGGKIESEIRRFVKIDDKINNTLYDTVSKFKTNIYDKLTKAPGYRNIQDALQSEKNKIFDYLTASRKNDQQATFKLIDPSVQKEAKQLKEILKESNTRIGNLLSTSKKQSYKDLAKLMINDADNFFKQRFAAFNNGKFKFDETGEVAQGALKELKKIIVREGNFRRFAGPNLGKIKDPKKVKDLFNKINKGKTLTGKDKILGDELTKAAQNRLNLIKQATINAGDNPSLFFGNISKIIGKDLDKLKPGETFPDAIKRFLSTPKGQKVEIKNYGDSLLETITYNAKQTYKNQYFDLVEDQWLRNNVMFRDLDEAIAKGIDPTRLRQIKPKATSGVRPDDPMFESSLFKEGYWTLPEISDAVLATKTQFDNFFDNPWYSNIMQVKAGAQIAKTIFSPMTQIRNVTTASFFPLASGLIGGRSSLQDAFKLVADDIFQGAKVNLDQLNKEIDDMVTRGVIDQNIQVNEIKNILDRAQKGRISFNSFMANPTVKKFVDVYQGGDNIWKVYSDRFYQSALKQAFGDPRATPGKVLDQVKDWYRTVAKDEFIETSAVTGQKKTAEDALKEVSAYLTTNTIPTYSKVPKVIQELRKTPIGNFVAFPAEILRTGANLMTIGARELTSTNPFIRQMGARRLIGASMTFGGIGTVVGKTAEYLTGVDEEIMDRAKRSFVPIYEKNATLIPLTKPDENGNFKYFNFSYSNPYDSLVRPINAVINAYGNGTLNKDSADTIAYTALFGDGKTPGALGEFFAPFITESIGTERIGDVTFRQGETRTGKKVFYPDDDLQTKIARGMEHIMGGLEPGAFTQARRVWEGATGQFSDAGTARNTRDELMAVMSGIRVQEVKPLSSMPFIITSFGQDQRNINSKFSRKAYGVNTAPEDRVSAYKENILDSFNSQKRLFQTIRDAEELGISKKNIREILEDRLKNKSRVRSLLRGEFVAPNYSKSRFESNIKRLENEDPAAALIYEDNAKIVMDVYDDMKKEVRRFDLDAPIDDLERDVDILLTPEVPEIRRLPTSLRPIETGTTEQGPNLPTGITGTPVSQQVVAAPQTLGAQFGVGPTGLTRTEQALLSPSEQLIRQRQRGFA